MILQAKSAQKATTSSFLAACTSSSTEAELVYPAPNVTGPLAHRSIKALNVKVSLITSQRQPPLHKEASAEGRTCRPSQASPTSSGKANSGVTAKATFDKPLVLVCSRTSKPFF